MKNLIIKLIKKDLSVYHIEIKDLTQKHIHHVGYDNGGHYKVLIVSDDFKQLVLLKRHQKIYTILEKMIKKEIHALSLQTLTINEYKTKEAR